MLPDSIRSVLARDLRALVREVEAYPDDDLLWRTVPGISNSAGTLTLHLVGNVRHYIGGVLGGTGYVRDRGSEFSSRDLTRSELRGHIQSAAAEVDAALAEVTLEQCRGSYPEPVGGRRVRTGDFLVHLVAHFGYHLGQIDYHRRILVPDAGPVPAILVAELPEV